VFVWPWAKGEGKGDHAVTLVGWGSEELKNGTEIKYWVVSGGVMGGGWS